MIDGIPFKNAGTKRKLEDLHANELRLKLENAGIAYADDASKSQLIALVKENKL